MEAGVVLVEEAGDGEGDDGEAGAVGPEAEPEDEGDEGDGEEEGEYDGAYELAEAGGEALLHTVHVVASAVPVSFYWYLSAGLDGGLQVGGGHFFFKLLEGRWVCFTNETEGKWWEKERSS